MIRHSKHIAFLLLGIFFFSILFQAVHIVWHHPHKHKCEHSICHNKVSDKDSLTNHENISETEETCLICEYKFPVKDSPDVFFFHPSIPAIAFVLNEIDNPQQYKQVFSDKTPRAPPALTS